MSRTAQTDSATPSGVQPRGLSGFGDPVFSDEFQGTGLDLSKWQPWYPPGVAPWVNTVPGQHQTNSNEPQGYDESGITFPGGGIMRFTLREDNEAVPELPFTSGMVSSGGKFAQTYGVFEARIKVPREAGSWAAFWLFPQANVWEYEIDIMENWGADSWNTTSLHTVHTKLAASQSEGYNYGEDVGINWHTYTLWWEPERIRIFVDGNLALDYTVQEIQYIYEKPMYVICNLAGAQNEGLTLQRTAPFDMDVAYIRVWENAAGIVDPSSNPEEPDPDPEPEPQPVESGTWYRGDGQELTPYTLQDDELIRLYGKQV